MGLFPHVTSPGLVGWEFSTYNPRSQSYTMSFVVPFHQHRWASSRSTGSTVLKKPSTYAETRDVIYVGVQLHGKYEHQYRIYTYCRVEKADVRVLVFPAFMSEASRLQELQALASCHHMFGPGRGEGDIKDRHIATYTLSEAADLLRRATHATGPAYVETSAKSKRLARLGSNNDADGGGRPKHDAHRSFWAARRQPAITIDRLKSYGTEMVKVQELGELQSLTGERTQRTKQSLLQWLWRGSSSGQRDHPQSIRGQISRRNLRLEEYLNHPQKLAVVAFSPQSSNRALRGSHGQSMFRFDRVVATALFTFVPFHKGSHTPTHVHLDAVVVDGQYDELTRPVAEHRTDTYGIRANFLRAALRYALHVGSNHDVVCDADTYITHGPLGLQVLGRCGFTAMPWQSPRAQQSDTPSLSTSWWTTAMRRVWDAVSSNQIHPLGGMALVYSALTFTCSSGNWKACVAKVRQLHPTKRFAEQLRIASAHYASTIAGGASSASARRSSTTVRRSRRHVSIAVGVRVLREFYLAKHAGLQAEQTLDEWADTNPTNDQLEAACKAIRHHLRHTQKSRRVLTATDHNTWKFRPAPGKQVTANTASGGPDSYYLQGLDRCSAEGKVLYTYPLGRKHTPTTMVVPPSDS